MDTKRIDVVVEGLTEAEGITVEQAIAQAQVLKVFSMLEPVELEALGDEETEKAITDEASGIEIANNEHYIWEDGFKAGMKEVVEWLQSNSLMLIAGADVFAKVAGHNMQQDISYYPIIKLLSWQAKLKEWKLEAGK